MQLHINLILATIALFLFTPGCDGGNGASGSGDATQGPGGGGGVDGTPLTPDASGDGGLATPDAAGDGGAPACAGGDCPPGSVRIITPVDGSMVCGSLAIEATATDDLGVAKIEFYVGGDLLAMDETAPYTARWDSQAQPDGNIELRATAFDALGQQASSSINVTVSNGGPGCDNLPNIAISEPSDGEFIGGMVRIAADAGDDVGVFSVAFLIDNGVVAMDNSAPYAVDVDVSQFPAGAHTIKVIATDTAGQTAETQITVTIDLERPTIAFISPRRRGEPDVFHGRAELSVEVSDNIGIANVTLHVSGRLVAELFGPPWTTEVTQVDLDLEFLSARYSATAVVTDLAGLTARDQVDFVLRRACDLDGDLYPDFYPGECMGESYDCDDNNAQIHPGAPDEVGDGIDQDCNGEDGSSCAENCERASSCLAESSDCRNPAGSAEATLEFTRLCNTSCSSGEVDLHRNWNRCADIVDAVFNASAAVQALCEMPPPPNFSGRGCMSVGSIAGLCLDAVECGIDEGRAEPPAAGDCASPGLSCCVDMPCDDGNGVCIPVPAQCH